MLLSRKIASSEGSLSTAAPTLACVFQPVVRLDRLEAATRLQDLAALPGNALEPLRRDRKGQYSIRMNDQWRICFEWPKGANGPVNVEITDYH